MIIKLIENMFHSRGALSLLHIDRDWVRLGAMNETISQFYEADPN